MEKEIIERIEALFHETELDLFCNWQRGIEDTKWKSIQYQKRYDTPAARREACELTVSYWWALREFTYTWRDKLAASDFQRFNQLGQDLASGRLEVINEVLERDLRFTEEDFINFKCEWKKAIGVLDIESSSENKSGPPITKAPAPESQPAKWVEKSPASTVQAESEQYVFRFTGTVFEIAFGQQTLYLADAKGLRYIQMLLARPQEAIDSVCLMNPSGQSPLNINAAAQEGLSIGSPEISSDIIDCKARDEYKKRLVEIGEERSLALEVCNQTKIAELDQEAERLGDELKSSVGLGGKLRKTSGTGEKARKAVAASINNALKKLEKGHPSLWKHLSESLERGATCTYKPKSPISWET